MTDAFVKYKEILNLDRGDIVETLERLIACHSPSKKGWAREIVTQGTQLRVMTVHEDAINVIMPTETGYKYYTIFCDWWARLRVVDKRNTK